MFSCCAKYDVLLLPLLCFCLFLSLPLSLSLSLSLFLSPSLSHSLSLSQIHSKCEKMKFCIAFAITLLFLASLVPVAPAVSSLPSPMREKYELYDLLADALFRDPFNAYKLMTVFFPNEAPQLVCAPFEYLVTCNQSVACNLTKGGEEGSNSSSDKEVFTDCRNGHNATFLWTLYDLQAPLGQVLLAYSFRGIALRGFNWEEVCYLTEQATITLAIELDTVGCFNVTAVHELLDDITSLVS